MSVDARRTVTLADELHDRGYATRPLLPPAVVDGLLASFGDLGIDPDTVMHRTFADDTRDRSQVVDVVIRDTVRPFIAELLPDHEAVLGTFISKGRTEESLDFHQDWTFTDERRYRTVQVWIPLVDVDTSNGTLAVIPGSHRWTPGIRPSTETGVSGTDPHQDALAAMAVPFELPAGTALLYDSAIIHGSGPNRSSAERPIAVVVCLPKGAPVLHFCEVGERVSGYDVGREYFTTNEFEAEPTDAPSYETWTDIVRPAEIERHITHAALLPPEFVAPTRRKWWQRR